MLTAPRGAAAGRQIRRLRADFGIESEALLRRAVWRVARRITPVMAVDKDGLRFYVSTGDQTLGRRLFCYRRVPQRDIQRAYSVLRAIPGLAARLDDNSVLEIGANIGSHTIEFLARYGAGSVVALEPDPGNFSLLRQNVQANDLLGRATLLQQAVSDVDGTVQLELSESNPGDHRVRVTEALSGGTEATRATIDVRAVRVDSVIGSGQVDLSATGLVWMDVQGHEAHALRGAGKLLRSQVPIVIEYWPYGLRRAGGLDSLHSLIAQHYSHVIDLRSRDQQRPRVLPAEQLPELENEYGWSEGGAHVDPATDLILAHGLRPNLALPAG